MRLSIDDLETLASAFSASEDACSQAEASSGQGALDIDSGGLSGASGNAASLEARSWSARVSQAASSLSSGAQAVSALAEDARSLKAACEAVPAALGAPSGPSGSGVADVEGSATGLAPQADSAEYLSDELGVLMRGVSESAGSLSQGGGTVCSAADAAAFLSDEISSNLESYAQAVRAVCDLTSEVEGSAPALFGAGVLAGAPRDPGSFQAWYEGLSDGQKALISTVSELVREGAPAAEDAMRSSAMASVAAVFAANPELSSSEVLGRLGLPRDSKKLLSAYSKGSGALGEASFDYEHPVVGRLAEVGKAAGAVGLSLDALDGYWTYQDKRAQIGEWMPDDEAFVKAGAESAVEVGLPVASSMAIGAVAGTAIAPGVGTIAGAVIGAALGGLASYGVSEWLKTPSGQSFEQEAGNGAVSAYRGVKTPLVGAVSPVAGGTL